MAGDLFGNVDVLVPARFGRARRELVDRLSLDVGALIDALPTASPSPASVGPLSDADLAEAKAWVLGVVRALPTISDVGAPDGAC